MDAFIAIACTLLGALIAALIIDWKQAHNRAVIRERLNEVNCMVNALYMQRTSYDQETGTDQIILRKGEAALANLVKQFNNN